MIKNIKQNKLQIIIIFITILIIITRLYFAINFSLRNLLQDNVGKVVTVKGNIINEIQKKDFSQTFIMNIDCIDKICNKYRDINIKVTTNRYDEYRYGDNIEVVGKILKPFNFDSNGGRTFDYIDYLAKDNIYYEIKKSNIKILNHNNLNPIIYNLFLLKSKFLNNLKAVLGEPHSALAGGLVVGEKASLGNDLIDDFRKAGLIHIVVLSGYNITIIAASIRKILSFLPRNISIILGGIGILLFGILVGGGATVVRSCIMASIALFAEYIRRDYNVLRTLFIAGALMLIQNPLILLYDPSFQLSFLATLGLILLSSPIEKKIGFITEKMGIRALVASTLATQIFVSPYILYMMGQISIVGIFVNIIVLPVIPITMLLVFLSGAFGFVSYFLSELFGWGSHFLLSYELFMVKYFANLPFSSINIPKFSIWIVIGFYTFYLAVFLKLPSIISQFIFKKKSSI